MKRIIFSLFIAVSFLSFAETQNAKFAEFVNQPGSLFIRNTVKLDKVKDIECQVLLMTNYETKEQMGCLQLESPFYGQAGKSVSTIEFEEIDDCIKGLKSLKQTMASYFPVTYTEIMCSVPGGIKLGAYFNDNNWTPYINNNDHTTSTGKYLTNADIDQLIAQMERAKAIISSDH